jgi:branched-chain amino acid transport system ATP-binding protein
MTEALRLCGIRAGYGQGEVLHGVDLAVPTGSTVALLGANGAGKTTLLRVAAGLLQPTSGEVWLEGKRVDQLREHHRSRRGLCLLPEGRGIFRQLSVRENLATFARERKVSDSIDEAAAMFPILKERLNQQAGTLSGGQQQMLAVARAFVSAKAHVILADEPSVGLAPIVIDEIFAAIETLKAQGRSLLIVEQYVQRALALADYVYILHKGTIAYAGPPDGCQDETLFERYLGAVAS